MNNIQKALTVAQVAMLTNSMIEQSPVLVHAHNGVHQGIVLELETEDGSGHNYNITLQQGEPFYVDLAKAMVVSPAPKIVWHDIQS